MTEIGEWQKSRMKFYAESSALDFINSYFNVKKGTRCIVGHVKDMYKLKRQPVYRIYENNKYRALTLPDSINGKYNALKDFWTIHSYMYTFNEQVVNWNTLSTKQDLMRSSLEGLNAVLELDSPEEPDSEKAKRLSFFDYVKDFDTTIDEIDRRLTTLGEDYNLMFSGNGIYVMLEGYYEDNLQDYIDNFINLLDDMKDTKFGNNLKVHIDNKAAPWNDYFKIPFTFHEKRPRISIPLPKGELDKEWIDYSSNVNNVLNDYIIIDKIIKKAEWRKLW